MHTRTNLLSCYGHERLYRLELFETKQINTTSNLESSCRTVVVQLHCFGVFGKRGSKEITANLAFSIKLITFSGYLKKLHLQNVGENHLSPREASREEEQGGLGALHLEFCQSCRATTGGHASGEQAIEPKF